MVDADFTIVGGQPFLTQVSLTLIEGEIDSIVVDFALQRLEPDRVTVDLSEVLLGLRRGRSTQTFVVLDLAVLKASRPSLTQPLLVVRNCEEAMRRRALVDFDNRRDELFKESLHLEQTRPKVVNEVDQESLDVRSIVVLVSHDHDRPIPQVFHICVLLAHVESHDLDQMLQLLIGKNRRC